MASLLQLTCTVTMNQTIHKVSQNNNKAIENLRRNNCFNAATILHSTLSVFACGGDMKAGTCDYENDTLRRRKVRKRHSHSCISQENNRDASSIWQIKSIPIAEELMEQREQDHPAIKVFNQALTFEIGDDYCYSNLSKIELCHAKALLFYNLALSHHIEGIRTGSFGEIAVALKTYHKCFALLEQIKEGVQMKNILLILLALFNNMGSIYAMHFEMEDACFCIDWLKKAISSQDSEVLEEGDYFFLYENLVKMDPMNALVLAPAA